MRLKKYICDLCGEEYSECLTHHIWLKHGVDTRYPDLYPNNSRSFDYQRYDICAKCYRTMNNFTTAYRYEELWNRVEQFIKDNNLDPI